MGTVNAHSALANDPARIRQLKMAASLATSLSEIKRVASKEKKS